MKSESRYYSVIQDGSPSVSFHNDTRKGQVGFAITCLVVNNAQSGSMETLDPALLWVTLTGVNVPLTCLQYEYLKKYKPDDR